MFTLISDPENTFLVVRYRFMRKNAITISINDIQPTEDWLTKESIDYFSKNKRKIIPRKIILIKSDDPRFLYHVLDGNNRLYVLYTLNYHKLVVVPAYEERVSIIGDEKNENVAKKTYDRGFTAWSQLKDRIIPLARYEKLMHERHKQ